MKLITITEHKSYTKDHCMDQPPRHVVDVNRKPSPIRCGTLNSRPAPTDVGLLTVSKFELVPCQIELISRVCFHSFQQPTERQHYSVTLHSEEMVNAQKCPQTFSNTSLIAQVLLGP
ncbi:hypothetical protein MTR_0001s0560 [Medicago truncatula]|uniref:Uncharacterized protein n=1 Tax=Medicago truncatula TaxID=3880 RepID=A0A072TLM7_MEDTR|nr:hypothetical protein MTR_0001s0560 [Medicago truncatula]